MLTLNKIPLVSPGFSELSIQHAEAFYQDATVLCPAQTHHCTSPEKMF